MKTKELRLRPYISTHDLARKVAWARQVLEGGEQVKVTVRLRGREKARPELGRAVIERVAVELLDLATADVLRDRDGNWSTLLTPKRRPDAGQRV